MFIIKNTKICHTRWLFFLFIPFDSDYIYTLLKILPFNLFRLFNILRKIEIRKELLKDM